MKQALTTFEQVQLLKSRKLLFNDEQRAELFLLKNNYYRVSGYWRKFQKNPGINDDDFIDGIMFEDIVTIYELDAQLRHILQKGLGVFEICFRSAFAYHVAHSCPDGAQSYLQLSSYNNRISKGEHPEELLIAINHELQRSREKSIEHYKNKNENVPIWATVEVLSFGTISKMYSRWIDRNVTTKVLQRFKLFRKYEDTWQIIKTLVYLRNLCAHQSRIWNRQIVHQPPDKKYLQNFGVSKDRAMWRIISILMSLVDEINQDGSYSKSVLRLCRQNEDFYNGLIAPTL